MEALAVSAIAKKALSWAWGVVKTHSGLLSYVAAAFVLWWLWSGKQDAIAERDAANVATTAAVVAHQKTKDDYRTAQAEAARLDAERIARAKARQQEINDAASKDYAQRLADLRARYQRLLDNAQGGSAAGSTTGNVAVPGLLAAPSGIDGAADLRLAGATGLCLTPQERLIAAEQAVQLSSLIDAVEKLAAGQSSEPSP